MTDNAIKTKILYDCYSDQDLIAIKNYFLSNAKPEPVIQQWEGPNFGHVIHVHHTLDWNNHEPLRNLVLPGLPKNVAKSMLVQECFYLQSLAPLEVHWDCGAHEFGMDEMPFVVFVIPFESMDAHTIIFNQLSADRDFVQYKEKNDPLPEDQCITPEIYDQYLSHCWPHERPYLNIDTIFRWTKGSLLMFDAHRWHASDNYHKNGVTEKEGLVIITKSNKTLRNSMICE